jgi:hypothetical protein
MDLLQNPLVGSSYVDASNATFNSAARDQLIINTMVNREFIFLLPVYLVSNSVNLRQHWTHFLMPMALLGIRTSYA